MEASRLLRILAALLVVPFLGLILPTASAGMVGWAEEQDCSDCGSPCTSQECADSTGCLHCGGAAKVLAIVSKTAGAFVDVCCSTVALVNFSGREGFPPPIDLPPQRA